MKECTSCHIPKPDNEDHFYFDKSKNRFRKECKDCMKKRNAAFRKNNPDYGPEYWRKNKLQLKIKRILG